MNDRRVEPKIDVSLSISLHLPPSLPLKSIKFEKREAAPLTLLRRKEEQTGKGKDLPVRSETTVLLEGHIGSQPRDLSHPGDKCSSWGNRSKNKQLALRRNAELPQRKGALHGTKRRPAKWENLLPGGTFGKELVSKTYTDVITCNNEREII